MSWLYLPGRGAESSRLSTGSAGERSAMSKMQIIRSRSSRRESRVATSMTRPSGATSERSGETISSVASLLRAWLNWTISQSQPGSPAVPGRPAAKDEALTTRAICGRRPFALLERHSLDGFSWRTPQGCFKFPTNGSAPLISNKSSATWPGWGMWDDGAAYRQRTLAISTNGDGCGLLPTPVARDGVSFYVTTFETSLRIMKKTGSSGRQLHWCHYGTVSHNLKKAWANPRFSEQMMGWPIGWTGLQLLVRDKFQQWLRRPGGC